MSSRAHIFHACDRCADSATEFDAHGNAWCSDCSKHIAQLQREARGANTRRGELLEYLNEAHGWLNRAAELARDTSAWRDPVQTALSAVTAAALDITETN